MATLRPTFWQKGTSPKIITGFLATSSLLALLASPASASCTGAAGTYTCSGSDTTTQTMTGTPLNVTVDNGYSANVATGNALTATGTNGTSINFSGGSTVTSTNGIALSVTGSGTGDINLDLGSGTLTGGSTGVSITQTGSGNIDVTSTGTITSATSNVGIQINKGTDSNASNGVTVSVNDVNGYGRGIDITNSGLGSTSLTATGTVTSQASTGINIVHAGTDLTVDTQAVTSTNRGINTVNNGTGATQINVHGDVTAGTSSSGVTAVYATNSSTATNLSITSDGQLSGTNGGILANNSGAGVTTITTNGTVTGKSTNGIGVAAGANAGNVTVTANAAVTGGTAGQTSGTANGISVSNNGNGWTTITAQENVTGNYGAGIMAQNGSATTVAGGGMTITTQSNVTGQTVGINAANYGNGGTVITAVATGPTPGVITGLTGAGIATINGSNSGNLQITSDLDIIGQTMGISVTNNGTGGSYIKTTGSVTGTTSTGISVTNGTVTSGIDINVSSVEAALAGIEATNNGYSDTVVTASVIRADGAAGVVAVNGTSAGRLIINAVSVTAQTDGISATNNGSGETVIKVTESVVANTGSGVTAQSGAATTGLTITTGAVTGDDYGIYANNEGTGQTNITTNGLVTSSTLDGISATGSASTGLMKIMTTDRVEGAQNGITANNAGTGDVTVNSSAAVSGNTGNGIQASTTATTPANIMITTTDTTSHLASGIVTSNQSGGNTTITASGTTSGAIYGINADQSQTTSMITIGVDSANQISGNTAAIRVSGSGSSEITNSGTIGGSLTNSFGDNFTSAIGIDLTAATGNNVISSEGNITGTSYAISAGSGQETVTHNTGTISGLVDLGAGADSFTANSGTIKSSVLMGADNDVMNLGGSVDISAVPQLGGGTGTDVLTLSAQTISAFTAASDDPAKGINLTGWETINANANTKITLKGGLFDAAQNGSLNIDTTSSLSAYNAGTGAYSIYGNANNNGTITMQDGAAGDVITITGNYTGSGVLALDTVLGSDGSPTDKLIVQGNVTGRTRLDIARAGGDGGLTSHGIQLVQVNGTSANDAFYLSAPVERGAYVYDLTYYGGSDQSWYLTSISTANPEEKQVGRIGATYEAGSSTALDGMVASIPTLEQRVGQRLWLPQAKPANGRQIIQGFWLRGLGHYAKITPHSSDAELSFQNYMGGSQIGLDFMPMQRSWGTVVFGLTGKILTGHADVKNDAGHGHIRNNSYSAGWTSTWYANNGLYYDSQFELGRLNQRYKADSFGTLKRNVHRFAIFSSQEIGYRFNLGDHGSLVPQAQMTWVRLGKKHITDKYGNDVHFKRANSRIARFGLAYEFVSKEAASQKTFGSYEKAYLIGNMLYDFSHHTKVDVGQTRLKERSNRSWAEIGLGGTIGWDERNSFYAEADYRTKLSGHGAGHGFKGTAGLRFTW